MSALIINLLATYHTVWYTSLKRSDEMKKQEASIWVREGLTVLAELGPEGLTIDELCRRLNLTKGSFYHHYANRSAYITALLTFWEQEMTSRVIEISQQEGDAQQRLRHLRQLSTTFEHSLVEPVIRAWACQDEMVRAYQERVDRRRLQYLSELCGTILADPDEGHLLAQIFYTMYVGAQHLVPPVSGKELEHLYRYFQEHFQRQEKGSVFLGEREAGTDVRNHQM
jgi:AcrR family transcriptional regulator